MKNDIRLKTFNKAVRAPAYRSVLKKHKIDPRAVKTAADFQKLPVIDKKNYIYGFPTQELFPDKRFPAMAYASSGSSGKPTFWFRDDDQEETGGKIHEIIFRKIFKIKKDEPTLVVVCFAMGVWVAGNYTLAACRYLSRQGYNVVTISPGIEKGDIFNALRDLAPQFKNLVLVGYPPFLMDIVNESLKKGIEFKNEKIKILTAGDRFSEEWRDAILKMLGIKDAPDSLVGIYGSADAAVLGHETPLSIFIRRRAFADKGFYKELFGDAQILPAIVQYHPEHIFFESADGELVFTVNTAAPLVRYNIHDTGGMMDYPAMKKILERRGIWEEAKKRGADEWKLPFVILKGRTDVAVTFYALNIFPEHIRAGVENRKVSKLLSGNFSAHNKTINKGKTQKLYIQVELAKGVNLTQDIIRLVGRSIVENLIKYNIEYRKLYNTLGVKALPVVRLSAHGDKNFFSHKIKGVLNIKGKKPRFLS